MLAPLKNRAILEKEPEEAPADGSDPDDTERPKHAHLETRSACCARQQLT